MTQSAKHDIMPDEETNEKNYDELTYFHFLAFPAHV